MRGKTYGKQKKKKRDEIALVEAQKTRRRIVPRCLNYCLVQILSLERAKSEKRRKLGGRGGRVIGKKLVMGTKKIRKSPEKD